MNDKKPARNTIDKEDEKTGFEKFEEEVKGTIFNVLYVLLKEDETSHWKHIILAIIDYLQMYHFAFTNHVAFPWKAGHALEYFLVFLDIWQVAAWLARLDVTTYLVFIYIMYFIVCLVILDVFYVSYSFSKKKFTFVWPLQALRSVCGLFVTVLFLPFLESFFTVLSCSDPNSHGSSSGHRLLSGTTSTVGETVTETVSHGTLTLTIHPEIECWHGMHIIHVAFAIVVSVIFMLISIVVSLTYFESSNNGHDHSAKVNSRADAFVIVAKIILICLYTFLTSDEYQWLLIVVLLILGYTSYSNFRNHWPYYNDKLNRYFCALNAVFFWGNICVFIAKIFEHTDFNGALQLYFLGLPLVIGYTIFDRDERVKLLLKNINNFQKGEEVALQIRYFLHLIQTKDHDRKNAIILNGYIYHHEDSCPNKDCQLKLYKQGIITNSKNKKPQKNHKQNNQSLDNYQLLLQHAKNMYRIGIQKFPSCTSLKIQYAFFLMEKMHKKTEALAELNQASQYNPPFDEQFLIYRYKKLSEDFGDSPHDGSGSMDVVAKIAYESIQRQFHQHIQRSATLHLEFWNYLREDRPDISKLNDCGSKINQSIIMVEQYWTQLQKLNTNVPKSLKTYAKFLIEILNDKEGGNDLLQRAKDTTNNKQNLYDGNNINEDDSTGINSNGTPCIFVNGENDKIGLVTQCNAGACRIFGYTPNEIKNHNVEKLMPEMYAKNHSKVLDDALAKGPENIPNKERLVFARHKSGYIFPVWLQLKMVSNVTNGTQFVALFKIDKKLISSSIGFVLVNKDKKIQGISSSCIKMMSLDIQKMRRLTLSGIDINKLAPSLFDNDNSEFAFSQKQGGLLEWIMPEFDKGVSKVTKANVRGHDIKRVTLSNNKLKFTCHLNSIIMGELGEIGWYLKLENFDENNQVNPSQMKSKLQDKIKQPLFQFRYEGSTGRFIREIKENPFLNNAQKDPNFVNGGFSVAQDTIESPMKKIKEEEIIDIKDIKPEIPDKAVEEPLNKEKEDIIDKKKRWASNIQIYRLVNGKFQPKDFDEEIKKEKQIEEERKKKTQEEEKNSQNNDIFKNSIKSRKALQMAINDKSTPPAIRNLKWTMNIVIMFLLAISITEFVIINEQFQAINENFNLVWESYGRISEVQRIAYDVRTLIMINEKKQKVYSNYTTQTNFTDYLKNDIEEALDNLYSLQNSISLNSLTMSDAQSTLMNTKSVKLYYRDHEDTLKTLKFSLPEAVLQISSAIFTVRHMNITQFVETQEDVFFITYNVFNDFLEALRQSSKYYAEDLSERSAEKVTLILALFLGSIGTMIVTFGIMLPVVSNVNTARMKVLLLFVDIPNHHVIALGNKCENFLFSIHEEHNDEVESEDNDNTKVDDSDITLNPMNKRGGQKHPKNSKGSNSKFLAQFGIPVMVAMAYFIAMFVLSLQFISEIKITTDEMNVLAQAESYYSFAQNVQREMIYDHDKPILGEESFSIARDTLQQLYSLNKMILDDKIKNKDILDDSYKSLFDLLYEGDLCHSGYIKTDLIPFDCEEYLATSPAHGLQTVIVQYFEILKLTLTEYVEYQEAGKSTINLINNEHFLDLYIIQFRFIHDSFTSLVESLTNCTNDDFQTIIDTRMAAFIVFIIGVIVAYLILWIPFVSKLNKEIWRTKSMLTIIPIEVILKIPRIQQFLHNQSFFSNKQNASSLQS